jgi:putative redox protein
MSQLLEVQIDQVGPTTAKGTARAHSVLIDRPVAKGGEDRGPLGGEYLLLALGGCFMSNLLAAIRGRDAEAAIYDLRITVIGTIDQAPDRFTALELKVSGTYSDVDLMRKLLTIAERSCVVTNTLKSAASITLTLE